MGLITAFRRGRVDMRPVFLTLAGLGLWMFAKNTQAGIRQDVEAAPLPDDPSVFQQVEALLNMSNGNMRISQAGIDLVKRYEGWRDHVYDANPPFADWTIGYGHKIKDGEVFPSQITRQLGEALLLKDLEMAENRVNRSITVPLTQAQFDALASMAYNLTLSSWGKAAARINRGDPPESVFPLYVYGSGKKLPGLVARRNDELNLYMSA